jgi:hypothetical protein
MLENTEWTIKNEKSRDTRETGWKQTKHEKQQRKIKRWTTGLEKSY